MVQVQIAGAGAVNGDRVARFEARLLINVLICLDTRDLDVQD
jgi:hypothetical protein